MLGIFGLLKNLIKILLQQLLAHSATDGPRKAERFTSPALKMPKKSVPTLKQLNLATLVVLLRGCAPNVVAIINIASCLDKQYNDR